MERAQTHEEPAFANLLGRLCFYDGAATPLEGVVSTLAGETGSRAAERGPRGAVAGFTSSVVASEIQRNFFLPVF